MSKQVLPLFLLAIIAVGGALAVLHHQTPEQLATDEYLFPSLQQGAQNVQRVVIRNAQTTLLDAEKIDGRWQARINEQHTYPVNETELSTLVNQLKQVRLLEAKTSEANKFHKLGLLGVEQQDSQAVEVTLSGDQQWQVLIGNTASSGLGSYAREPETSQSWLLNRVITLPTDNTDWLQQPIWDIEAADITRLQLNGEQGWVISRAEQDNGKLTFAPLDETQILRYDGILEAALNNVATLRFEAFAEPKEQIMPAAGELSLRTDMGEATLTLFEQDDQYLLRISTGIDKWAYLNDHEFVISSYAANQLLKEHAAFLPDPDPAVAIEETETP